MPDFTPSLAAAIVSLAKERRPESWEVVLQLAGDDVWRLVMRMTGDASRADDIVQETLLIVRDRAHTFLAPPMQADAAAKRWILGIAVRATAGQTRHLGRRRDHEANMAAQTSQQIEDQSSLRLENQEQVTALRQALQELPLPMREAVILRHLGDQSVEAIAQSQQCPVGTIKTRIHRGLAELRRKLAKSGLVLLPLGLGWEQIQATPIPPPPIEVWRGLLQTPISASPELSSLVTAKSISLSSPIVLLSLFTGTAVILGGLLAWGIFPVFSTHSEKQIVTQVQSDDPPSSVSNVALNQGTLQTSADIQKNPLQPPLPRRFNVDQKQIQAFQERFSGLPAWSVDPKLGRLRSEIIAVHHNDIRLSSQAKTPKQADFQNDLCIPGTGQVLRHFIEGRDPWEIRIAMIEKRLILGIWNSAGHEMLLADITTMDLRRKFPEDISQRLGPAFISPGKIQNPNIEIFQVINLSQPISNP